MKLGGGRSTPLGGLTHGVILVVHSFDLLTQLSSWYICDHTGGVLLMEHGVLSTLDSCLGGTLL